MTTIVATKTAKGVEFAFDSQTTWGGNKLTSDLKVFSNGVVTFGVSGACRDGDILQYNLVIPKFHPKKDLKNPERWVVSELIPAIQKSLEHSRQLHTENSQAKTGSHIIISVPGLLGMLATDLSLVGIFEEFVGVGSGAEFALGALYAGASLKEAVTISAAIDNGTGGKINVMEVNW